MESCALAGTIPGGPSRQDDRFCRTEGHRSAVRFLAAKATVPEPNLAALDVVAEAPATQAQPVLALAWTHAFQLLDVITRAEVVWIRLEDFSDAILQQPQVGVLLEEFTEQPLLVRRATDGKRRRHTF